MSVEALIATLAQKSEQQESNLIHRAFGFELAGVSIESRTAEFIFSSEAIDSHDEIVKQDWMQRIKRYEANPVVLYNHNKSGLMGLGGEPEDTLPIGFTTNLRVEGGQLRGTVNFVLESANPMAELVWQGVVQRSIRAGSVGFRPHKVSIEKHDGVEIVVMSENELYEFSICPMGSNPEATISGKNLQAKERSTLLAIAETTAKAAEQERKTMDTIEELKATVAALESKTASLETDLAKRKEAEKELVALQACLVESRDVAATLQKRVEHFESELIAKEVSDLVGKKITPAQCDQFVELRASMGKEKFEDFVAKFPEMTLTQSVTGDKQANNKSTTNGVVERAKKAAAEAIAAHGR